MQNKGPITVCVWCVLKMIGNNFDAHLLPEGGFEGTVSIPSLKTNKQLKVDIPFELSLLKLRMIVLPVHVTPSCYRPVMNNKKLWNRKSFLNALHG